MQSREVRIANNTYSVSGDNVITIGTVENESILGSELSYDTATIEVNLPSSVTLSTFKALPYGTKVEFLLNGTLTGAYFLEKMKRVSERGFELSCISAIGLLDKQKHAGGIYKGSTFSAVLADILGGTISGTKIVCESFDAYIPNSTLNAVKIYGWLPYDTRRNNLRKLLLAVNAHVFQNSATKMPSFEPLSSTSSGTIQQAKLYVEYSEEIPQIASKITVTEHAYFYDSRADSVELFNNSTGYSVTSHTVIFSQAPIYKDSIVAEGGLTIVSKHENYAVVTGRGILKGIPYAHNTFDVIRTNSSASTEYEVSLSDDGLISIANSEMVADRLLEYYTSKDKISADIVYTSELCGKRYSFTNRYGESILGYLSQMKKTVSSFVKAACEFLTGYVGADYGNNYDAVVKLTGSGTWTKPSGVTRFRAVLIGGGSGGNSGFRGEDGSTSGNGGKGGAGGAGGDAGWIYEKTFDVASASADYSYSCGAGGSKGISQNLINKCETAGGATFNVASSYSAWELVTIGSNHWLLTQDYSAYDITRYSTTSTYKVGDVVLYANLLYFCISPVTTAGTWSSNSSKFKAITSISTIWDRNTEYAVGDCVAYAKTNVYRFYCCIVAAPKTFEPGNDSYFKEAGFARFNGYTNYFGGAGGDTTLTVAGTSYSAASGAKSEHGFADVFNDIVYAVPSEDGVDGGDGGDAGTTEQSTFSDKARGADGTDVVYGGVTYSGGIGASGKFETAPTWSLVKNFVAENGIDLTNAGFSVMASIGGGGGGGAAVGTAGNDGNNAMCCNYASHVLNNVVDEQSGKTLEKYDLGDGNTYRVQEYIENTGGLGGAGARPVDRSGSKTEGSGGDGGHGGGGAGGTSAFSTASGNIGWYKVDFCQSINQFVAPPTSFSNHKIYSASAISTYTTGTLVYGNCPYQPDVSSTGQGTGWYVFLKANESFWYRGVYKAFAYNTFYPLINCFFVNTDDNKLYRCVGTAYAINGVFDVQVVPDMNAETVVKRSIRDICELCDIVGGSGGAGDAGADGCILIYYKS